jgi:hypothetical protein
MQECDGKLCSKGQSCCAEKGTNRTKFFCADASRDCCIDEGSCGKGYKCYDSDLDGITDQCWAAEVILTKNTYLDIYSLRYIPNLGLPEFSTEEDNPRKGLTSKSAFFLLIC